MFDSALRDAIRTRTLLRRSMQNSLLLNQINSGHMCRKQAVYVPECHQN